MNIEEIAGTTIPVLKTTDQVGFALELMLDQRLLSLPVVNEEGIYLGLADYDQLSEEKKTVRLGKLELLFADQFLTYQNSVYDAIRLFQKGQELVVILNEEKLYQTAISSKAIIDYFARLGGVDSPGAYLTLRIERNNYALSEIARIAESNNAIILSLLLSSPNDADKLDLTLKFNITDLTYLIATFERFSYEVTGYHHQSNIADMYNDRYWSLMRYLNT